MTIWMTVTLIHAGSYYLLAETSDLDKDPFPSLCRHTAQSHALSTCSSLGHYKGSEANHGRGPGNSLQAIQLRMI